MVTSENREKEPYNDNLLFPARGDGTLVLGLPGPSVKKENKDKDMVGK